MEDQGRYDGERARTDSILIWDRDGDAPDRDGLTVLWSRVGQPSGANCVSLAARVEQRADELRGRYLEWLHELGQTTLGGRRVVDHLQVRPGLSFWWMASLAQKFNAWGASPIHDAIKLLALEELLAELEFERAELISDNERLARCLAEYFRASGKAFNWRDVRSEASAGQTQWRLKLPMLLRAAVLVMRYVSARRSVLTARRSLPQLRGGLSFVDIFVHLDHESSARGVFRSNYWTRLVDLLSRRGDSVNWLHLYFKHKAIDSYATAEQLVERFNGGGAGRQLHALIDAGLSIPVLRRAWSDYLQLRRSSKQLRGIARHFRLSASRMNLWPLFEQEWASSLCGPSALHSCLELALFEAVMAQVPRQNGGFYILENQPWEFALIHAWRSAGHGTLVGVAHSTVRYWDLRYFYDPRTYDRAQHNALPLPDLVAVNGPAAKALYTSGGYPSNQLVELEALRYLYLTGRTAPSQVGRPAAGRALRVLICGDFHHATSHKLLSWMQQAAQCLPVGTEYLFKPHPAYPIDVARYATLNLNVTDAVLADLLPQVDVVFASCITSGAVDAYCMGVPVVQMHDGNVNFSPLRGIAGASYVSAAADLAAALLTAVRGGASRATVPYFFVDDELPKWRDIVERMLQGDDSVPTTIPTREASG